MRISEARNPATAGSAAICAALALTSIGVHPVEQATQQIRVVHTTVQLQAASVGSPEEILTNLANAAITTVGAAAWFAAFPVTVPASIGIAWAIDAFRNAGFPTLRLDELLGSGLQVFVSLPTYAVQNAFTALGQSIGLIALPATVVRTPATAARTATIKPVRTTATPRDAKKPAASSAKQANTAKNSAAQRRHATPR